MYGNRAVEIAACHMSHISAAKFLDGSIYMWGHCRGHSVYTPSRTSYVHLDDVFACYSNPAVTWRTLEFQTRKDVSLAESVRLAFNDSVIELVDYVTICLKSSVVLSSRTQQMFVSKWTAIPFGSTKPF